MAVAASPPPPPNLSSLTPFLFDLCMVCPFANCGTCLLASDFNLLNRPWLLCVFMLAINLELLDKFLFGLTEYGCC